MSVDSPPWLTGSIAGVVFTTTRTSASSSHNCPGEGVGIGAARVGAAWGVGSSAWATGGGAGIQMRQAGRRSLGGRTRLTGRTPKSTGAASAGGASGAE